MADNLLIYVNKDHVKNVFSLFRSLYKTEYNQLEEKLLNLLEEVIDEHPIDVCNHQLVIEHVSLLHILYISFNEYFEAWLEALGVEDEFMMYKKMDTKNNILLSVLEEKEYIEDLLDKSMNLLMDKKISYGKKISLLEEIQRYKGIFTDKE